jgi:succinate dehydrogenase/fumarate reductase flavoprotein subunit
MRRDYDVIVVGGGGSGLAAAVSAAEHGAAVLLLEKRPTLGGTTGIAVGSFTASGTRTQQQAGIVDNADDHAQDAARFAPTEIEARNNERLRQFFLAQAAETIHWLMEMGVQFHGPNPEPPNRVARMHNVVPGAKAYIDTLQARFVRLRGTILTDAPVEELLQSEGGVCGVAARVNGERSELEARCGVVLAAGDYANSTQLIQRFKGERFAGIEGINPHSTGDGHLLAERVGAKLVNMDVTYGPEIRFIAPQRGAIHERLPTHGWGARLLAGLLPLVPRRMLEAFVRRLLVTWQHPENALFDDGAILINSRGERFCDETLWPQREIAVAQQPGKIAYLLLDERLIDRYNCWPHFISTAPQIAYAYVADYLRLRPDIAIAGASVESLAACRGLPVEELRTTLDSYNQQASDRGRPRLSGQRWMLLGPAKAYFTTTEGGAAINQSFQVLDQHDRPIPGLYAVGQNGLGGQILWGHGLHIAWAMTSGRLVGRQLASMRSAP